MNGSQARKELLKGIFAILLGFAVVEALIWMAYLIRNYKIDYIPLPHGVASDYGPQPPWLISRRLIRPDKELVWRGEPNMRETYLDLFSPVPSEENLRAIRHQFFPTLPAWLKNKREWRFITNSEGFRDIELPRDKAKNAFRIICLGDSWTAGSNVDQEEAYPQRLKTLLKKKYPDANFEVFNLGVFGYASYNGLKLLKGRAIDLQPDLVILAFAMNEPSMAGYKDKDAEDEKSRPMLSRLQSEFANLLLSLSERIQIYQLLRYWALMVKWQPRSIGEYLKGRISKDSWIDDEKLQRYETLEPWMKLSLQEYEKYHTEMIDLLRHRGGDVILLYNEFWTDGPYLKVLQQISRKKKVELIDSSLLLSNAKKKVEEEFETRFELKPDKGPKHSLAGELDVVFRVYAGEQSPSQGIFISGNHLQLGNLIPNKIAMYDDGRHGDQKTGDKVWSFSAKLPKGTKVSYVYTNSGQAGKWTGLDVPAIRSFKVPTRSYAGRVYAPIDSFGEMYMRGDAWHTNAVGNDLIARAVLGAIETNEKVKRYLRNIGAQK